MTDATTSGAGAVISLRSEFADIDVRLDDTANGARLRVHDRRTGMTNFLDPLELEGLVWARHDDLAGLLDPSAYRWRSDSEPVHRTPGSGQVRGSSPADIGREL